MKIFRERWPLRSEKNKKNYSDSTFSGSIRTILETKCRDILGINFYAFWNSDSHISIYLQVRMMCFYRK